jgi:hypothetical protein
MHISTNQVSSVVLGPKKLEIRKIVKGVKEPEKQTLCHEIEPNPWKDRTIHERDNPSFWNEFIKKNIFFLSELFIFVFKKVPKYLATGLKRPSGTNSPPAEVSTQGLKYKTNTIPILMHQMHISTNEVSSVVLIPKKLEIRKIVKSVKEPKKKILCHEIEPNPSKDRAMHAGDNPSFWDEFIKKLLFSWQNYSYSYFKQVPKYLATGLKRPSGTNSPPAEASNQSQFHKKALD